ncbi:calcium-binding protein [Microcoleus vaginatus DQ-U2]|uniref:calcium-binding protein n=1 Tax=Microcoleus vaginatus TaxID=119532 RepID=UPI001685E910|nr:calcium-binding protein [Microcoleus sp. FACHB-DQ6]
MASYAIFDEPYYLAQYPWVKSAIDAGVIKSGREHFEKFGQAGGLTQVSRYFDENTYLAQNPDLAAFVRTANNPNAPFASGLDHFIQFGYEQGRTRVSPDYDEDFYLKRYPKITPFVENGIFKSGFQHFVKFGANEGLYANTFFEREYLQYHRDVAAAVQARDFKTGGEHYRKFGQFEPNRTATFMGTSGNDIVTGFGVENNVDILGVQVGIPDFPTRYESHGWDEFDTLIGGSGRDTFVLGDRYATKAGFVVRSFYEGPGFATIQNFTKGQDRIQFPLDFLDGYILFPINNNRDLAIQNKAFDTLAVIEGGGNLSLNKLPIPTFDFLVG